MKFSPAALGADVSRLQVRVFAENLFGTGIVLMSASAMTGFGRWIIRLVVLAGLFTLGSRFGLIRLLFGIGP